LNYVLSNNKGGLLETYLKSVRLFWEGRYKKALEEALRGLRRCEKESSFKYLFLSHALTISKALNETEMVNEIKDDLLRNFHKISPVVRPYVMPNILNISVLKGASRPRYWSELYEKDSSALVFIFLALAREEAKNGNISSAISAYKDAYRLASSIPHPSAMIASLNDIAWYVRDRHAMLAKKAADCALFFAGFYREFAQSYALDTLFEVEKLLTNEEIIKTARIILTHKNLLAKGYPYLLFEAQKLAPSEEKTYINSTELPNYLMNLADTISDISRKSGISRDNVSKILKMKTQTIRGNTLGKIVKSFSVPLDLSAPEAILKEKAKMIIHKWFRESTDKLSKIALRERRKLFLITYAAQLERNYLSRKDKFLKSFDLLTNVSAFRQFMLDKMETLLFTIDMTNAHAFIEGKKAVIRKAIEKLSVRRFQKFIETYARIEEKDRQLLDRFLRNCGRYQGTNLQIKLTGPSEVKRFARLLNIPTQSTLAAYWCEDDGRVKRRLIRILDTFLQATL